MGVIKWVHENLFQFYLSSIKRRTHSPDLPKQCSFNSTLVQLKVEGATPYFGVGDSFNSTLVQLKERIVDYCAEHDKVSILP